MTQFVRHAIPDVIEVTPPKYGDNRGFFSEVFKQSAFEAEGIRIDWIQDNQSLSAPVGTVRGLHFQAPPVAQDKLVRVLRGAVYDVALDIRKGSPTYGQHVGVTLSAEKWNQLLVPVGFAHCFMTLEPDTEVLYKVSGPYSKEHEGAIRWNDPALGIDWPDVGAEPTLSEKDLEAPLFADFDTPFTYEG
ncbi:dTDP-4-dehydrorhamnose 3,5-epimerase [Citromicrobium bathyomarinum]|uniref:dTDP-4-dehydrorhamnose 3,5-epimerase n=1 Tax=Sphingomonadales TaxID=204457 RepID=UPI001A485995|nr:dTDP-4-dehydrorhamnose 3,5-epimerase [Citromicrobium sp.]